MEKKQVYVKRTNISSGNYQFFKPEKALHPDFKSANPNAIHPDWIGYTATLEEVEEKVSFWNALGSGVWKYEIFSELPPGEICEEDIYNHNLKHNFN